MTSIQPTNQSTNQPTKHFITQPTGSWGWCSFNTQQFTESKKYRRSIDHREARNQRDHVFPACLFQYDYNVIGIDWSDGAREFYPKAVANTRVTGAVTAELVRTLMEKFGLKPSTTHIIGHSLGAHTAGYVGRRIPGLSRITGMVFIKKLTSRAILYPSTLP